jgi:MFS family permease
MFGAQAVSVVGDQFARVALAILVFDRTASAALTALTYGLSFLPDLVAGPLLSGLADRYPRRTVMVVGDVLRGVLVAAMALPGMPLWSVWVLLFAVGLIGPPADAARLATVPAVFNEDGPAVTRAMGTMQAMAQAAQVVGFAAGGILVAIVGAGVVLLADAGSFAVSALAILLWVRRRPAPAQRRVSWWQHVTSGVRVIWADGQLRAMVGFCCVSGFYIAGEALAAPYAAELGAGPTAVGLIFAAYAAGCAAASVAVPRLPEPTQLRSVPPLVVGACAPLLVCLLHPPLPVVVAVFVLSGAASAFFVVVSATFNRLVPDTSRGLALGLARTTFRVAQGFGVALAGVVAQAAPPHLVVAGAGGAGILAALAVTAVWAAAGGPQTALARLQPSGAVPVIARGSAGVTTPAAGERWAAAPRPATPPPGRTDP